MSVYLKRKVEERKGLTAAITGIYETAGKADRDLNEGEKAQVGEMEKRCAVLDEEIERFTKTAAATQKFMGFAGTAQEAEDEAERRKAAEPEEKNPEQRGRTLTYARESYDFGKTFVESDAFKNYEGAGRMKPVPLPGPASAEFRAAITTADIPDAFKTGVWDGPPGPAFTTPLLSLLNREQVSTSSTTWLRWPEASEAGEVAEGEPKPEADLEPEEVAIALRTFAHWKAITRQALEDVAQIQSIVQARLLRGVVRKLQSAAATTIAGSTGIVEVAAPSFLEGVRTAIALLEELGYEPNAVGLNPNDAAALDFAAMANTVAGAVRTGGAWGLPYAPAAAFPRGTLYVADFSQAVTWFDRGNTQAYITDSHADYFIRNQLVVLAEARGNFAVTEPPAIVKVTVAPEEPAA